MPRNGSPSRWAETLRASGRRRGLVLAAALAVGAAGALACGSDLSDPENIVGVSGLYRAGPDVPGSQFLMNGDDVLAAGGELRLRLNPGDRMITGCVVIPALSGTSCHVDDLSGSWDFDEDTHTVLLSLAPHLSDLFLAELDELAWDRDGLALSVQGTVRDTTYQVVLEQIGS